MEWIQLLTVLMSIVGSAFTFFIIIRNDIRYMEEKWEKNIKRMDEKWDANLKHMDEKWNANLKHIDKKWERLFGLFVAQLKKEK